MREVTPVPIHALACCKVAAHPVVAALARICAMPARGLVVGGPMGILTPVTICTRAMSLKIGTCQPLVYMAFSG